MQGRGRSLGMFRSGWMSASGRKRTLAGQGMLEDLSGVAKGEFRPKPPSAEGRQPLLMTWIYIRFSALEAG
ncbi:hypothetical protein D7T58_01420 [Stenotrophomonas maltophilia]|nr:hypothetical protein [Stenotrophomonas maltophilia]MBA0467365.1 hypothetical protein [Stenotrophomonas maltophilia]MBA0477508.1 hypothetical protein [Stenotrophomonas maltophilia]MBA0485160.1 hypothetical protein [Stenotrophomonas maltophilia]